MEIVVVDYEIPTLPNAINGRSLMREGCEKEHPRLVGFADSELLSVRQIP
jgi:hypothetical protein